MDITEDQMDQCYVELLVKYNKAKESLKDSESKRQELQAEINAYQQQVTEMENQIPEKSLNGNALNNTENHEIQKSADQKETLQRERQQRCQKSENNKLELKKLTQALGELSKELSVLSEPTGQLAKQKKEDQLKHIHRSQEQIQSKLIARTNQIEEEERKLSILAQESLTFLQPKNQTRISIESLRTELDTLEKSIISLNEQISSLEKAKEIKVASQKTVIDKMCKQLEKVLEQNTKIKEQLKNLNEKKQKQANLSALVDKSQHEIKNLQNKCQECNKQIQSLQKAVVDQKKALKEQKQKPKAPKNYKMQIKQAQNDRNCIVSQIDLKRKKITELHEIRKSYVSQESLEILKRQYERHNSEKKQSSEAEKVRNNKLKGENVTLKKQITYLENAHQQSLNQKEEQLAELKEKWDKLVSEKHTYEKTIAANQQKLKDYKKEYPHHEQQKEERKKQEKRLAAEERKAKLQEMAMKTTSKKGKKKTEPKDEDEYELIKKEDPLISPQEKSKFYDNKAVQIVAAAGVIALGTIVGLSL